MAARRSPRAWLHASRRLHTTPPDTGLLHAEEVAPPAAAPARGGTSGGGGPPHTLCVLHGLLGVGRNLRSVASSLVAEASEQTGAPWRALLVDQRNHGRSARVPGLAPPHTLAASARGKEAEEVG